MAVLVCGLHLSAKDKDRPLVIRNVSDSTLTAHIGKYRGNQWDTLRSVTIAPGQTQRISQRDLDTGLYVISDKKNVQRIFFLSKTEEVDVEFAFSYGAGMLKVKSQENKLLDSLDRTVQYQLMEADMISTLMNQLQRTNPRYYTLMDSLSRLREEKLLKMNGTVRGFVAGNPSSPVIRAMWPLYMLPCRSENPAYKKAFETEESFMLMHFWDYLNDANRHVTNHPMFYNKVNEYFFRFADKSPQGLMDAGDRVVSVVEHNPIARSAVVKHILNLFQRNTGEEFYLNASDHFLSSCENEAAYADERKMAERIRNLKVGLPAPDITLFLNEGKKSKLSDFKGETVVLVFWASWCPHCLDELPDLSRLSAELRPRGVRFVSIALDDQASDWQGTIASKGLKEWTNSCEFKKWNSEAVRTYNVHSTPAIYVIAPDGKIMSKDIHPKNLSSLFVQN